MFTGIVEGVGRVVSITESAEAVRLVLEVGDVAGDVRVGDSVAVSGCCLTAVEVGPGRLAFDMIRETLERTSFAGLKVGDGLNVERSMPANGRFHGHVVSGHVDGVGRLSVKRVEDRQVWVEVEVEPALTRYMIEKGSITLDGVSLTLTAVREGSCAVALIPHTVSATTFAEKEVGARINVEVDAMGKWVEKLLGPRVDQRSIT